MVAQAVGITQDRIQQDIRKWVEAGTFICTSLCYQEGSLTDLQRQQVYQYYLPVFFWVLDQLAAHKASGQEGPLVVRHLEVYICARCLQHVQCIHASMQAALSCTYVVVFRQRCRDSVRHNVVGQWHHAHTADKAHCSLC